VKSFGAAPVAKFSKSTTTWSLAAHPAGKEIVTAKVSQPTAASLVGRLILASILLLAQRLRKG
jgi:hypothetical protein